MPRPLSIVHVGELAPFPGGAGIRDQWLLSGLAEAGHSVATLAPVTGDLPGEAVARANRPLKKSDWRDSIG